MSSVESTYKIHHKNSQKIPKIESTSNTLLSSITQINQTKLSNPYPNTLASHNPYTKRKIKQKKEEEIR
jgi:hypothetical protein